MKPLLFSGIIDRVRVFKNRCFSRFADKEDITDNELKEAVNRLEQEQVDADLGGGVYKMRVARPGEGKSGGYRVIVFFKSEFRTFFVYGFAKSDRDNINERELKVFKANAKTYLALTEEQIEAWLKRGTLKEVL